ncbi:MAG: cytochrome c oxidase subunit I [Actinomycetota bacterium]
MATIAERLEVIWGGKPGLASWLMTVDHKRIGLRYLYTGIAFFVIGGIEALILRTQLTQANLDILDPEAYNQLFSMHGTTMMFLFAVPALSGFGNFFVPLMIGSRDMAFPRLNSFGYWAFLGSGIFMYSSFLVGSAPNNGWFNYVPLGGTEYTPGVNIDFYVLGLVFLGVSTTGGAINFVVTILKLRAPGMSINRMPIFVWGELALGLAIVFAQPALTTGLVMLELDRKFGFNFFDARAGGDPVLWQHLFWIFGHPWVYIIVLPAFGLVSMMIPVLSGRRIIGYTYIVLAEMAVALIGFGVWAHHMFAVGIPQIALSFISASSFLVTIPSAIQVFAWLATLVAGKPQLKTPMLFVLGFIVIFVIGGLSGVMFAAIPFDQQTTDSYFVVAHFHYVLIGGAVFPIFGGLYYWLPKMTGRLLSEGLGKVSFWLMFVGFNLAFFPMHISGLLGQPRRTYTYEGGLGWDVWNLLATIGSFVLALGVLVTLVNWFRSAGFGPPAGDDPWGGETLEWSTTSPPPEYNFETIPAVRSLHPMWDQPELHKGPQRPEDGAYVLADGHETLGTSMLDAGPQAILRMPHESPWPVALTVALMATLYGVLVDAYVFAGLGAVACLAAVAGWFWPRGETQET